MSAIRIAMWSGPRNISTAMMRSFGQRSDTAVSDEPFYAAYLAATGLDHPMRDAVLAGQPCDCQAVEASITGPVPMQRPVWYQKHMTHHMLPQFDLGWLASVTSAFLIRRPEAVAASYVEKRAEPTLDDLGFAQQAAIFERVADRLGRAPPVIEAGDVLRDPRRALTRLCDACGIGFDDTMLTWPPGRRDTDGAWAPAWYDQVERSTGFARAKPDPSFDSLPDALKPLADAARPYYERLARFRL